MSADLAVAFLEACIHQRSPAGDSLAFDTTALARLHSISVPGPGRCTAVLPVTPEVANRYGTLHGGCIATLVDTVGTAALVSMSPKGGVSLNINTNYLSKAPLGGSVLVEAQVVRAGKTIATIDVQLRDESTGALVAQGTHVKFISKEEAALDLVLLQQEERNATQEEAGVAARRQQQSPRSKL